VWVFDLVAGRELGLMVFSIDCLCMVEKAVGVSVG